MVRIKGKSYHNNGVMVMDAEFLAKNTSSIKLKPSEHLKIIGSASFDKIDLAKGAVFEGDSINVHRLTADKYSVVNLKMADEITAFKDSYVNVEKFNNFAKIRGNATVLENYNQLTYNDGTNWSTNILPGIIKTTITLGSIIGAGAIIKNQNRLDYQVYTGMGFGLGTILINDKASKFFKRNYTVRK